MTNAIIACETLRDELNLAIQETGCLYPIIWVESDYHNFPDKLRLKLQEEIDKFNNIDNILFAFGSCGNGLVGLKATTAKLIIPKTEDCISMLLSQPGCKYERHKQTYFLTRGWMRGSRSIFHEYTYTLKKYGKETTKMLFEEMLKHYKYLMLIDSGAYNLDSCRDAAGELAHNTNLSLILEEGNIWFLKKLLMGPYDDDFIIIKKDGH